MSIDISPTACCNAAASGNVDALRAIHKAGGNVAIGDYDKRTATHLAASENQLKVLQFLVDECRVDPSPLDRWGGTPLDDANRNEHQSVITYLTKVGAKAGSPVSSFSKSKDKTDNRRASWFRRG